MLIDKRTLTLTSLLLPEQKKKRCDLQDVTSTSKHSGAKLFTMRAENVCIFFHAWLPVPSPFIRPHI